MSFCFKNTPIVIFYQCTEEIIPQQPIMGNVVCKKNHLESVSVSVSVSDI